MDILSCCSLKVRPPLPMDFSTSRTHADCAMDAGDTAKYRDSILIIPRKVYFKYPITQNLGNFNACINSVIHALF